MGKRKKTSGENEVKYGKFSRKIRRVGYVIVRSFGVMENLESRHRSFAFLLIKFCECRLNSPYHFGIINDFSFGKH